MMKVFNFNHYIIFHCFFFEVLPILIFPLKSRSTFNFKVAPAFSQLFSFFTVYLSFQHNLLIPTRFLKILHFLFLICHIFLAIFHFIFSFFPSPPHADYTEQ